MSYYILMLYYCAFVKALCDYNFGTLKINDMQLKLTSTLFELRKKYHLNIFFSHFSFH